MKSPLHEKATDVVSAYYGGRGASDEWFTTLARTMYELRDELKKIDAALNALAALKDNDRRHHEYR